MFYELIINAYIENIMASLNPMVHQLHIVLASSYTVRVNYLRPVFALNYNWLSNCYLGCQYC